MNFMASECGSGCESGWTLYLEQSFVSGFDRSHTLGVRGNAKEKKSTKVVEVVSSDEEEEDLSMVSDASSGPPHFQEDESRYSHYPVSQAATFVQSSSKRHRNKEHHQRRQDEETLSSFLDDTASSPLINFSQNNVAFENKQASMESVLDYSQGFSATEFEGRPLYQNHYDSFQSSSLSGNQQQRNQWY